MMTRFADVDAMFSSANDATLADPSYFGGYALRGRVHAQQCRLEQGAADMRLVSPWCLSTINDTQNFRAIVTLTVDI